MCRVRKSHSDTALSGLEHDSADKPSAVAALKADGQPEAAAAVQVTFEALKVPAI